MAGLLRVLSKNKKTTLVVFILAMILAYMVYEVSSPKIILHITRYNWSSWGVGGGSYTHFLVKVGKGDSFELPSPWGRKFKLKSIVNDTTVIISFDNPMVVAGESISDKNIIYGVAVGLNDVTIRTPTLDSGADFLIRVDTTKAACDSMRFRIANILEIAGNEDSAE